MYQCGSGRRIRTRAANSNGIFYANHGNGAVRASSDVAGMAGLEPTISESKSGVLPLHYIPRSLWKRGRRRRPLLFLWGGIWGSNPRHPEPQSGALPTELIPPNRLLSFAPETKPGEAGPNRRWKKEPANVGLSPPRRKRNAAGFFRRWHAKRDSNPRPTA